jgi:chemotaxis protein MotB
MLPELRKNPSAQIRLLGYADNAGLRSQTRQETPTNIDLSVARAASVAEWLAKTGGIAAERIEVAGQGTARPVASNATPSGRSENRRVDVYLVSPPAAK